jgi:hypothetical protein
MKGSKCVDLFGQGRGGICNALCRAACQAMRCKSRDIVSDPLPCLNANVEVPDSAKSRIAGCGD